jgi:hypothetical protein
MTAMTVSNATKTATQTNTADALPAHARLETRNGLTSVLGEVSVPKTGPLPDFGSRCERVGTPRYTSPDRVFRCGAGIGCRPHGVRV